MKVNNQPLIDVTSINEKIYSYLRQNIIRSYFPAGSRLNVKQLSKEFGVSETPIKDALFRLAGEGLVGISSRSGTYVRKITKRDIHEILKVRLFLERSAVEVLAEKITDDQLQILQSIYNKHISINVKQDDVESYQKYMECDSDFHNAILTFLDNIFLIQIYKNLNAHMQTVRFLMMNHVQGKLPTTDNDHRMILEALFERNPEKAKKAVENHLKNADIAWGKIETSDYNP